MRSKKPLAKKPVSLGSRSPGKRGITPKPLHNPPTTRSDQPLEHFAVNKAVEKKSRKPLTGAEKKIFKRFQMQALTVGLLVNRDSYELYFREGLMKAEVK